MIQIQDFLAERILDNLEGITFRYLSTELNIDINTAKKSLIDFANKYNDSVQSIYIISGTYKDGNQINQDKIILSSKKDLKRNCKLMESVTSIQIYGVYPMETNESENDTNLVNETDDMELDMNVISFKFSLLANKFSIKNEKTNDNFSTNCIKRKNTLLSNENQMINDLKPVVQRSNSLIDNKNNIIETGDLEKCTETTNVLKSSLIANDIKHIDKTKKKNRQIIEVDSSSEDEEQVINYKNNKNNENNENNKIIKKNKMDKSNKMKKCDKMVDDNLHDEDSEEYEFKPNSKTKEKINKLSPNKKEKKVIKRNSKNELENKISKKSKNEQSVNKKSSENIVKNDSNIDKNNAQIDDTPNKVKKWVKCNRIDENGYMITENVLEEEYELIDKDQQENIRDNTQENKNEIKNELHKKLMIHKNKKNTEQNENIDSSQEGKSIKKRKIKSSTGQRSMMDFFKKG